MGSRPTSSGNESELKDVVDGRLARAVSCFRLLLPAVLMIVSLAEADHLACPVVWQRCPPGRRTFLHR